MVVLDEDVVKDWKVELDITAVFRMGTRFELYNLMWL
jgi:hypothetical protein